MWCYPCFVGSTLSDYNENCGLICCDGGVPSPIHLALRYGVRKQYGIQVHIVDPRLVCGVMALVLYRCCILPSPLKLLWDCRETLNLNWGCHIPLNNTVVLWKCKSLICKNIQTTTKRSHILCESKLWSVLIESDNGWVTRNTFTPLISVSGWGGPQFDLAYPFKVCIWWFISQMCAFHSHISA